YRWRESRRRPAHDPQRSAPHLHRCPRSTHPLRSPAGSTRSHTSHQPGGRRSLPPLDGCPPNHHWHSLPPLPHPDSSHATETLDQSRRSLHLTPPPTHPPRSANSPARYSTPSRAVSASHQTSPPTATRRSHPSPPYPLSPAPNTHESDPH